MAKKIDIEDNPISAVERVLADAQGSKEVICITLSEEGDLAVLTSIEYMPDVLWAMELARAQVLETGDDGSPEQ